MAKKGPSLSPMKYGISEDYDIDNLLSAAAEDDYELIEMPEETSQYSPIDEYEEEDYMEYEKVVIPQPVREEPKPTVNIEKEDSSNRKLHFNEIQEPVVWGSNVVQTEIVIEEEPIEVMEEIEEEPVVEEPVRRQRTSKPVHTDELPERAPKPKKEKKEKKEKVKKEKPKKNQKPQRIKNAESQEEFDEQQRILEEEKAPKKEKKEKVNIKDIPYEELDPKSARYKKLTKIYEKYPKEFYDPTDVEIDEKDGKEYFYFNIEKTLRKYNLLFITKIISLAKLEELTFDNPSFDGIAQKQHDQVVKLNALSAEEQYNYENKNKMIKLGSVAAIILLLFFHITNNVIPENNFKKATEQMVAGNYEESYYGFSALGTKYESYIYAKYNEGQMFLKVAKQNSSGTAGQSMSAQEKQKAIEEAIEKYNSAKECFELLTSYNIPIGNILNMEAEAAHKHLTDLVKECDYSKARMLYQNGKFEEAAAIFKSIHDYNDSTENYYKCIYEIADNYYEDGDYFLAIDYFYPASKASYSDSKERLLELAQQLYDEATLAFNKKDYEHAIEYFAFLADYNYIDSEDMINKCRYSYALDFYKVKDYQKAIDYFSDIEEYRDSVALKKECVYKLGVIAYNQNPVSSIKYFADIPGFKNSDAILDSNNLALYGQWEVIEMDGNAIPKAIISFDGDGLLKTESANILGIAISTEDISYNYKWNGEGYGLSVEGQEYILQLKIIDRNNMYLIAKTGGISYEYKLTRVYSYLEMLAQNNESDFEDTESLTLNQKLTLLIEDYIELKTDGMYLVNDVLTDINGVKTQMNNALKEEIEHESNQNAQEQASQ